MTLDFEDILGSCGGRLTFADAQLLYETAIDAKNIVEVGAMDGCSSMILGEVARQNDGHLYSIEPKPKGKWRANIERLGLERYVTLIYAASPWYSLPVSATPIDYYLIDGDHRTRWVLVDYHYLEPHVRPGGRVAFHDWCGPRGVSEWVQEAVALILRDDPLIEVGRAEGSSRGLIVFEKP